MKRGNDSGSDNMVFSVFYGTNLLACREAKPGRVIPGRGIIGTSATIRSLEHSSCIMYSVPQTIPVFGPLWYCLLATTRMCLIKEGQQCLSIALPQRRRHMDGKRILIDTDPGVDDSMMLQCAFKSPEIHVEAITTVFGNNTVDITSRNALKNGCRSHIDVGTLRHAAPDCPVLCVSRLTGHRHSGIRVFSHAPPMPEGSPHASIAAPCLLV